MLDLKGLNPEAVKAIKKTPLYQVAKELQRKREEDARTEKAARKT